MNTTLHVHALVHEVSVTIRLMRELLAAIHEVERRDGPISELTPHVRALESRPNLDDVPQMLGKAHRELMNALGGLRATRQTIQDQAITRLRDTNSKLHEVTTATEDAATSMLDSLDRASAATESLADSGQQLTEAQGKSIDVLRLEIGNLFNSLQFQDITAQQISGASERLRDVESRLEAVADVFGAHKACADSAEGDLAYNPDATHRDAEARQRVADSVIEAANEDEPTHDVTVPDA